MQHKVLAVLVSLFFCMTFSQAETLYHKDHLFNLGMGMRPLAMGKAFTAGDNDVNAMIFNPAGLATIQKTTVQGLKVRRFADVDQYTMLAAYALPENNGVLGMGYLELSLPDILIAENSLDASGYTQVAGKAKYAERAYVLSYAKRIDQQAFGLNIKAYGTAFTTDVADITDDVRGNANALDLGYMYYLNPDWTLGCSYRDAIGKMRWSTDTTEKMRAVTRWGSAYNFRWRQHHGTVYFDYEIAEDTLGLAHLGIEDTMWDVFTIRLGGMQRVWSETTKFSVLAGIGVNYSGFSFDYAYFPDAAEETDNKHFFSLGYAFNMGKQQPNLQTPTVYAPSNDDADSIDRIDTPPARAASGRYVDQHYNMMESAY